MPPARHCHRSREQKKSLQEDEHWHLMHVRPQEVGLAQVNYFLAGTFVLESLYVIDPRINYVLIDSDAVPTALWEVKDLALPMHDLPASAPAMSQSQ